MRFPPVVARVACYLALLSAFLALPVACRLPPPTSTLGKVIRCSTEAVEKNGPALVAPVNTCLTNDGDATACLLGLVRPAAGITQEVIACVVRHQEKVFAESAAGNEADVRSWRAAERAREFTARYTFEGDPDAGAP
jgi:hypothetical protein